MEKTEPNQHEYSDVAAYFTWLGGTGTAAPEKQERNLCLIQERFGMVRLFPGSTHPTACQSKICRKSDFMKPGHRVLKGQNKNGSYYAFYQSPSMDSRPVRLPETLAVA